MLIAAIQHSLWKVIVDDAFGAHGLPHCPEVDDVANALYQKSQPDEAVWRILTVNAILDRPSLLERTRRHLETAASQLLASWEIFEEELQKTDFRTKLLALLVDHSRTWLSLLKQRELISVSLQWGVHAFVTDTGEDAPNVPGNFTPSDGINSLLVLSPAFFQDPPDGSRQPRLLVKGKALLENSPLIITALKEEQVARSPRMSRNKPQPLES